MHNKGCHQVLRNNYRAADTPHGKENQATAREIKIVKNRVRVIRCPSKTRFWHRKGPPNQTRTPRLET